ncbi:MAE_28990/MAE_18760 family HEPN-like nuclease [Stenotrophomonas maltophilia]|uniref:MAE_28990/MAE_18760 family HEPN-like nuclease n=1 Tax=Stenotrophomonas maltophilia TaxID=40324 RepID=UPI0011512D19|nr:MAE_28990/MAE_18760 family HEPN-like nuclease [Stenotrophomonas maltophilia]TQM08419.1 hypothetical protein FB552_1505 [Stenotrophomonas maltophilia]
MFTAHRNDVTKRITEVRLLLDLVRNMEAPPPAVDSLEVRVLRGLFFVHLYSALEFTINGAVERFLAGVGDLRVKAQHFEPVFLSVALDSTFSSLRMVSEEKRWPKRREVWSRAASEEICPVNSGIFGLYLQNVWVERIDALSNCLNIGEPMIPNAAYRAYVDELVDRRNGVAHGRFSAAGVGGGRRSPDLQIRFNAISETCLNILDVLEDGLDGRCVVQEQFRGLYP